MAEESLKKAVSEIHARFRQLRSGELADTLRAQGVVYRLAWGLESYRLREIAQAFEPNAELAQYLWEEEVRESKMIATRLYPIGQMERATAEAWAHSIEQVEIADQACMNLFARLPYAEALAGDWTASGQPTMLNYLGLMIANRIDLNAETVTARADEIRSDSSLPMFLRTAAAQLLNNLQTGE